MSKTRGFTLSELLITLTIIGVLVGLSAPGLQTLVQKKEGEIALRTVAELLAMARSTAVTNNVITTLCRSTDGLSCSGTWSDGSMVFTDRNADRIVNQDDRIIRTRLFPELSGTVVWRAFQNRQFLQIDALGFLRHQSGNFTYCPQNLDARLAHQLIVNRTGRARYALDTDADGIRENSRGESLQCQ